MCPNCARWSPPDPETGYDVDELCPDCRGDELGNTNGPEEETCDGGEYHVRDSDLVP